MTANNDSGLGGDGAADASPHAEAFSVFAEALDLVHAGDVARVRALAELGRSALREARRDGVRGMASDMELRSVAAPIRYTLRRRALTALVPEAA